MEHLVAHTTVSNATRLVALPVTAQTLEGTVINHSPRTRRPPRVSRFLFKASAPFILKQSHSLRPKHISKVLQGAANGLTPKASHRPDFLSISTCAASLASTSSALTIPEGRGDGLRASRALEDAADCEVHDFVSDCPIPAVLCSKKLALGTPRWGNSTESFQSKTVPTFVSGAAIQEIRGTEASCSGSSFDTLATIIRQFQPVQQCAVKELKSPRRSPPKDHIDALKNSPAPIQASEYLCLNLLPHASAWGNMNVPSFKYNLHFSPVQWRSLSGYDMGGQLAAEAEARLKGTGQPEYSNIVDSANSSYHSAFGRTRMGCAHPWNPSIGLSTAASDTKTATEQQPHGLRSMQWSHDACRQLEPSVTKDPLHLPEATDFQAYQDRDFRGANRRKLWGRRLNQRTSKGLIGTPTKRKHLERLKQGLDRSAKPAVTYRLSFSEDANKNRCGNETKQRCPSLEPPCVATGKGCSKEQRCSGPPLLHSHMLPSQFFFSPLEGNQRYFLNLTAKPFLNGDARKTHTLARCGSNWKVVEKAQGSGKTLRRFCKAYERQQGMRTCFGAWLAFSRKMTQLRLQQQLQQLRSIKAIATIYLFHWTQAFIAKGARRIFLRRKAFWSLTTLVLHSRQELQDAIQKCEMRLKGRVLSCMRQNIVEKEWRQKCYRCIKAAARLSLYRGYWKQWIALLKQRASLRWGLRVTVHAVASCKRAVKAEAFTALRDAAATAISRNDSKLKQRTREKLSRWMQHWRCMSRRQTLSRTLALSISANIACGVWREWRKAAATAAATATILGQRAEVLLTAKNSRQVCRCLQMWRNYSVQKIYLRDSGHACMLNWLRQLFTDMQRTAKLNKTIRLHAARQNTAVFRNVFCKWVLYHRRRRRNKVVMQLFVAAGRRALQHEALRIWVVYTAQGIAAATMRRYNLLDLHWRMWRKFSSTQKRLKSRENKVLACCSSFRLSTVFWDWQTLVKQRIDCRKRAFMVWRLSVARRRRLLRAIQSVRFNRNKILLLSILTSWKDVAQISKHCRTLAAIPLYRKGFKGFKACRRLGLHLKSAAELVFALRSRFLLASVIQAWSKLQQRLQELRQRQMLLRQRQLHCSLHFCWGLWRRRAAAAAALRQWVAQALDSPIKTETVKVPSTTPTKLIKTIPLQPEAKPQIDADAKCTRDDHGGHLQAHQQQMLQEERERKHLQQQHYQQLQQELTNLTSHSTVTKWPSVTLAPASAKGESPSWLNLLQSQHSSAAKAANSSIPGSISPFFCKGKVECVLASGREINSSTDVETAVQCSTLAHSNRGCNKKPSRGFPALETKLKTLRAYTRCNCCSVCSWHRHSLTRQHLPVHVEGVGKILTFNECRQSFFMPQICHRSENFVGKVGIKHHGLGMCQRKAGRRSPLAVLHARRQQEVTTHPNNAFKSEHRQKPSSLTRGKRPRLLRRKQLSLWGEHLLVLYWKRKLLHITSLWRLLTARKRANRCIGRHYPMGAYVNSAFDALAASEPEKGFGATHRELTAQHSCSNLAFNALNSRHSEGDCSHSNNNRFKESSKTCDQKLKRAEWLQLQLAAPQRRMSVEQARTVLELCQNAFKEHAISAVKL